MQEGRTRLQNKGVSAKLLMKTTRFMAISLALGTEAGLNQWMWCRLAMEQGTLGLDTI
jgi:hypothetical protein